MRATNLFLRDILERIERIQSAVSGRSLAQFEQDLLFWDSIERNLEVIGEAARHLPDEIRALRPEVPWRDVVGLRNILIHRYHGVETDILWSVVQDWLPLLKAACLSLLDEPGAQA